MRILLLAAALAAAAGCNVGTFHYDTDGGGGSGGGVGGSGGSGGSGGGSGGATGQQYFGQNVEPNLQSKCSACHMGTGPGPGGAPTFLGAQPTNYYPNIRNDPRMFTPAAPSTSLLVTKGMHEGPAWTATEAGSIQSWLMVEASASTPHDGGTGDGP